MSGFNLLQHHSQKFDFFLCAVVVIEEGFTLLNKLKHKLKSKHLENWSNSSGDTCTDMNIHVGSFRSRTVGRFIRAKRVSSYQNLPEPDALYQPVYTACGSSGVCVCVCAVMKVFWYIMLEEVSDSSNILPSHYQDEGSGRFAAELQQTLAVRAMATSKSSKDEL